MKKNYQETQIVKKPEKIYETPENIFLKEIEEGRKPIKQKNEPDVWVFL